MPSRRAGKSKGAGRGVLWKDEQAARRQRLCAEEVAVQGGCGAAVKRLERSDGLMSDELKVGARAPEFRLPASDGREVGLADYRDKAIVVLFFVREYN